jgi:hypothetical protein
LKLSLLHHVILPPIQKLPLLSPAPKSSVAIATYDGVTEGKCQVIPKKQAHTESNQMDIFTHTYAFACGLAGDHDDVLDGEHRQPKPASGAGRSYR